MYVPHVLFLMVILLFIVQHTVMVCAVHEKRYHIFRFARCLNYCRSAFCWPPVFLYFLPNK